MRRRLRQQQNDDQRADGQPDHGNTAEDAGGGCNRCCNGDDCGQHCARIAAQQIKCRLFQHARVCNARNKKSKPKDEEHRVQMNQLIQNVKKSSWRGCGCLQHIQPAAQLGRTESTLQALLRPGAARKSCAHHKAHAVGKCALLQLVCEGAEQKEAEDGGADLDRQQPHWNGGTAARSRRNHKCGCQTCAHKQARWQMHHGGCCTHLIWKLKISLTVIAVVRAGAFTMRPTINCAH